MVPISHLVDSPRPRCVQVQSPPDKARPLTLVSARWRVHVPLQGEVIADTTTAGADIELINPTGRPARMSQRDAAGCLALVFWINRGTEEVPQRAVLAAFVHNPTLDLGPLTVRTQTASFEIAYLDEVINVAVSDGKPLLELTQVRPAPGKRPMLWCRSRLHELLGLGGGQYRLDEVRLDLPLVSRVATASMRSSAAG